MKIHQAFGRFIDLEAVALISGSPPTFEQLQEFKKHGWLVRGGDFWSIGTLTVQLVLEPVKLFAKLPEGELTAEQLRETTDQIAAEWEGMIEAWKVARS